MQDVGLELRSIVDRVSPLLAEMDPEQTAEKESPTKWSQREILGHLIDSAANNHQRFVRACYRAAGGFPTYRQEDWVRVQRYNESAWRELVELWSTYNRHLSDLIVRLPEAARSEPCNIGKDEPVALEFVIRDYLRHLRHHLNQILPGPEPK